MKCFRRVTQFFHQLPGFPLNRRDRAWVTRHLSSIESALFYRMSVRDQRHAVQVSRRVMQNAALSGIREKKHVQMLVKAALLHDIGRERGTVGIVDKVLVVLIRRWMPHVATALSKRGRRQYERDLGKTRSPLGRISRAFYIQDVHPHLGAGMARRIGVEAEVIRLIRDHHSDDLEEDVLLASLKEADF